MPNRIIREGLLDSEKINALSPKEQMFFVRLMLIVDDFGRYDARPELIKSKCYPVSEEKIIEITNFIKKCSDVKLIKLYKFNDKKYLEIIEFRQRTRIMKSKFPCPTNDGQMTDNCPLESNPIQSNPNPIRIQSESEIETEIETETIIPEHRVLSEKLKSRILEHKQQKIEEHHLKSWDNEVRLMIKRDGRTLEQIGILIDECHDMEPRGTQNFTWRNNILSMGKLRENWNLGKIFIGMNPKPQSFDNNPYQKGYQE